MFEGQCDGDRVADRVKDVVVDTESVGESDCDSDGVPDRDGVKDTVDEIVTDRHCVTVPVSDAMDGDGDGVDPAGAQNGPMLNVARCVPSMVASGDADTIDGDADADEKAVGSCVEGGGE